MLTSLVHARRCNVMLIVPLFSLQIRLLNFFIFFTVKSREPGEKFWQRRGNSRQDFTQALLLGIIKQEKKKNENLVRSILQRKMSISEIISDEMSKSSAPIPNATRQEAGVQCYQKWINILESCLVYKEVVGNEIERDDPSNSQKKCRKFYQLTSSAERQFLRQRQVF